MTRPLSFSLRSTSFQTNPQDQTGIDMKTRVVDKESKRILHESDASFVLTHHEEFIKDGRKYVATGSVANEMLGETEVKTFFVVPEESAIRELNERL